MSPTSSSDVYLNTGMECSTLSPSVGIMRLIWELLKIKFKIEDTDDNVYDASDSENDQEASDLSTPVTLSCVGWNTQNLARIAA